MVFVPAGAISSGTVVFRFIPAIDGPLPQGVTRVGFAHSGPVDGLDSLKHAFGE